MVPYRDIYGEISPHMELFLVRFRLDHPEVFLHAEPVTLPEDFDVETVQCMNRVEFFDALRPLFVHAALQVRVDALQNRSVAAS